MTHILTGCPFSRTIWYEVLPWIQSTGAPRIAEGDFAEWWSLVLQSTPRQMHKGTSSLIALTTWWLWKHRNVPVFDETP